MFRFAAINTVPLTLLSSSGISFLLQIKYERVPYLLVGPQTGKWDQNEVDLLLGVDLLCEVLDGTQQNKLKCLL